MEFNKQFNENVSRHVVTISTEKHPLFEKVLPLTPAQMLRRIANGQPLSLSRPQERININKNFFSDNFDILDTAISVNRKISSEFKEKMQEARQQELEERKKYEEWKKTNVVNQPPSVDGVAQ